MCSSDLLLVVGALKQVAEHRDVPEQRILVHGIAGIFRQQAGHGKGLASRSSTVVEVRRVLMAGMVMPFKVMARV